MMKYNTNFKYNSREEKAKYVWLKYKELLKGKILDVGADKSYLKNYLPDKNKYTGIGFGTPIEIDFEKNKLPYKDNSFDCVLCLDVLEHLDNIHNVFDELCRVTKKYVITALPNTYGSFISMIKNGNYSENCPMEQYNLPVERPEDRHKWFFNLDEAEKFIRERGNKNNMGVLQIDREKYRTIKRILFKPILKIIIHKDVNIDNLLDGSLWTVLEKKGFSEKISFK